MAKFNSSSDNLKPNGIARTTYPSDSYSSFEEWYDNYVAMKRFLIPAMCVFSTFNLVVGQDIRIEKVDAFDESITRSTKWYEVGKSSNGKVLMCAGWHIKGSALVEFWVNTELGCAGAIGNYVMFKFDDGSTLKIDTDEAPVNCKDYASSFFLADDFPDKVVTHIRLRQGDTYMDIVVEGKYTVQQLIERAQ